MTDKHLVQVDYDQLLKATSEYVAQSKSLRIAELENELEAARKLNNVLMIGLRAIDERIKDSKDVETDLKYCGEIAFAAIAIVEGRENE